MKQSWIDKINAIQAIVINNDPAGLIGGGAPADEYDFECLNILVVVLGSSFDSDSELENKVTNIFTKSFGSDGLDQDKINQISDEIRKLG